MSCQNFHFREIQKVLISTSLNIMELPSDRAAYCSTIVQELNTLTTKLEFLLRAEKLEPDRIEKLINLIPGVNEEIRALIEDQKTDTATHKPVTRASGKSVDKKVKKPKKSAATSSAKGVNLSRCPDVFLSEE